MKNVICFVACLGILAMSSAALAEDCSCGDIKKSGSGWCGACKSGAAFGVKVKSAKLYKALQGKQVKDVAGMKCSACKTAAQDGGTCDQCQVSFPEGSAYRSPVAHTLAQGHTVDASKMKCTGCKSAAEKGAGYCKGCKAGFVGKLTFHGAELFAKAQSAMKTLKTAAKAAGKCEGCAVGMVSDGECAACKLEFKDGKPQKKA